jgi:hypothetical protein
MTKHDTSRWGMMKSLFALAALVVPIGCIHLLARDPWMSGHVIGVKQTAPKTELDAAWRGEADPWKGTEKIPDAVIGGESALDGGKGAAAAADAALSDRGNRSAASVEGQLVALAARVDRLERLVDSGAASAAPRAAAPSKPPARPIDIYKVDPSGQTAWISAGTQNGIKKGQTLDVKRGGKSVAVARVVRVWPDSSELAILWASGKLQRGDTVVPR